jgi:hypothetical protein
MKSGKVVLTSLSLAMWRNNNSEADPLSYCKCIKNQMKHTAIFLKKLKPKTKNALSLAWSQSHHLGGYHHSGLLCRSS